VPPLLAAKHRVQGGAAVASAPHQSLSWQDSPIDIGLDIDASNSKSLLYAFELYGEKEGPRYIRALPFDAERAALDVDAVESTPVLSLDGSDPWPVEEVFVLATEKPNADLEEYVEALEEQERMGLQVPFVQKQLLESLTHPARGTSRAEMAPARRKALEQLFDTGPRAGDDTYAQAGLKPYYFEYRMQSPGGIH